MYLNFLKSPALDKHSESLAVLATQDNFRECVSDFVFRLTVNDERFGYGMVGIEKGVQAFMKDIDALSSCSICRPPQSDGDT